MQKFGGQTEPSGVIKKKVRVKREMWNRWRSRFSSADLTDRERERCSMLTYGGKEEKVINLIT